MHIKTVLFSMALMLGISFHLSAQNPEATHVNKTRISVEIDPATFAFKGFGVHLRIQPKSSEHLLIGVGAYAMNMPDILVNLNKENRDKGWSLRLNQGFGLFGEYHFSEVNKGLFAGGQVGIQQYKIELEGQESIGDSKYSNGLAMGYLGYTFAPFKHNLYIKPWAGIGYTSQIAGDNTVGSAKYDIAPITMFATLHIGYTF